MYFIRTILSFAKDKAYNKLLMFTASIVGLGTVSYKFIEGWSWVDSLYFSVVTLTTVGYGDVSPQTDAGKLFTIVYIIIGLGLILNFIEVTHAHYEELENKEQP